MFWRKELPKFQDKKKAHFINVSTGSISINNINKILLQTWYLN